MFVEIRYRYSHSTVAKGPRIPGDSHSSSFLPDVHFPRNDPPLIVMTLQGKIQTMLFQRQTREQIIEHVRP